MIVKTLKKDSIPKWLQATCFLRYFRFSIVRMPPLKSFCSLLRSIMAPLLITFVICLNYCYFIWFTRNLRHIVIYGITFKSNFEPIPDNVNDDPVRCFLCPGFYKVSYSSYLKMTTDIFFHFSNCCSACSPCLPVQSFYGGLGSFLRAGISSFHLQHFYFYLLLL